MQFNSGQATRGLDMDASKLSDGVVAEGVFRTPDERFEGLAGYDFAPHYEEIEGLRLHYVDEGEGRPVVLFHGEPTWSYLYRDVITKLSADYRVIAPDYAGFGRSDKPTDRGFYSYEKHCDLIGELLLRLDLNDATVVVHDWGGPIGLRWAVENEERVESLVIMNTGLFTGRSKASEGFLAWRSFAEQQQDLPVGFVIQSGTATTIDEDTIAAYEAPFPNAESKAGAAQFPLIVPLSESDAGAGKMHEVMLKLERWQKPALVLFSDSDPIFHPLAGQKLVDHIPGAGPLRAVAGASHFLQEDRSEEVASEVLAFLEAK